MSPAKCLFMCCFLAYVLCSKQLVCAPTRFPIAILILRANPHSIKSFLRIIIAVGHFSLDYLLFSPAGWALTATFPARWLYLPEGSQIWFHFLFAFFPWKNGSLPPAVLIYFILVLRDLYSSHYIFIFQNIYIHLECFFIKAAEWLHFWHIKPRKNRKSASVNVWVVCHL